MGFTEVLTILFIVLKLLGVIDWNWFLVLLPEIIAIIIYILFYVVIGILDKKIEENFDKIIKEIDKKDNE